LFIQLGIATTMKVGLITDLMLSLTWVYVQPAWLNAVVRRSERWAPQSWLFTEPATGEAPSLRQLLSRFPVWQLGLGGLLSMQYALAAAHPALWRRLPAAVGTELQATGLELKVDLFSAGYSRKEWSAPGVLADGTKVDVMTVAAPQMNMGIGWRFTRWLGVAERGEHPYIVQFGDYLCRRYREARPDGAPLQRFTILKTAHPPPIPGAERPSPRTETLLEQECSSAL
jgi:hypothetical protein